MIQEEFILKYDHFLRSIEVNRSTTHSFLLGAGASISSHIQSASDCIWEWKRSIYVSNNPEYADEVKNYKSKNSQQRIQRWLDAQGKYPKLNDNKEYSTYVEETYPLESDRTQYFENLCQNKEPGIGYKILCLLSKAEIVKSVWTTNFDGLTLKAAYSVGITPIEINLDNSERIFRVQKKGELLCVALHGDYKYSKLKNTEKELDNQDESFKTTLNRYFADKNLIVIGYSGRDKSLMSALLEAFSSPGKGRLYWCGYNYECDDSVENLIKGIRANGREAYYIPTNGFDETLLHVGKFWLQEEKDLLKEYNGFKSENPYYQRKSILPFKIEKCKPNKLLVSNLHPISLPRKVYCFNYFCNNNNNIWDELKRITERNNDVIAIPFKGKIFTFGRLNDIKREFSIYIQGELVRENISTYDIKNVTQFQHLYLSAISISLSKLRGLKTNRLGKLWKPAHKRYKEINGVVYYIYEAVEISFCFSEISYIKIKPTIHIETASNIIPKEVKIIILGEEFNKLFNKDYHKKLNEWNDILFNGSHVRIKFPYKSESDTEFSISHNTALCGINVFNKQNYNREVYITQDIEKKLVLNGIELPEPELIFNGKYKRDKPTDIHPMRGITINAPYDNSSDLKSIEINLVILSPAKDMTNVINFLYGLNKVHQADSKDNYLITYNGFESIYRVKLNIPQIGENFCVDSSFNWKDNITKGKELADYLCRKLIEIKDLTYHDSTIIIFIPEEWKKYYEWEENKEIYDLHNYVKSFAASNQIKTQFIEEATINENMKCRIYWWLSLSLYVKSFRTPWLLKSVSKDTAYAGIGYSVTKSENNTEVVLGCSHIYNTLGEGLQYKLSQINDYYLDNKRNPYLKYDEAFEMAMSISERFHRSMEEYPKRVVIHKRTEFKEEEINGLVDSFTRSGVKYIDLITIKAENNTKFIATKSNDITAADFFPVTRGTCIQINDNEVLLWTHGNVKSVKKDSYNYYLGGKSIPSPLSIHKYYGISDINTIASEIMALTKMNWNSFDLYSKLPATIESSNKIAQIAKSLLSKKECTFDYRYFI